MFKFLFKILKKKKVLREIDDRLDEAEKQGFTTREEVLRLRSDRADKNLKEYLKENK